MKKEKIEKEIVEKRKYSCGPVVPRVSATSIIYVNMIFVVVEPRYLRDLVYQ